MQVELMGFQKKAVNELKKIAKMALLNYRMSQYPQVISLQAPTGAGKTIIMAAFIEEIYYVQPDAVFVWLSDSPSLNEQSKQKIDLKANRIKAGQTVTIEESSFNMEILEDGKIYFLNTQKLSRTGNLGRHSDGRDYTIWETLANTAREKADRFYFIIDEAHRGAQGAEAGRANTIMQRFIMGSEPHGLKPMPLVIGMSATAERFNRMAGNFTSTLHKVLVSAREVRESGLLKERIIVSHPGDATQMNDLSVLHAAALEWQDKCRHWHQYCYEQHYAHVNPVFVIQVLAGSAGRVSDTNLNDVIAKVEEAIGDTFGANEVVHTFGAAETLTLNGLEVKHIEPSDIAGDRRIKVVLFKENLSTGWDCPRAEVMMSFRKAEDATYIAQLLGRMVRTPLQCHIEVDDSLNNVHLYMPYFRSSTVEKIIDELKAVEGGDIANVEDEDLDNRTHETWRENPRIGRRNIAVDPRQTSLWEDEGESGAEGSGTATYTANPGPDEEAGGSGSSATSGLGRYTGYNATPGGAEGVGTQAVGTGAAAGPGGESVAQAGEGSSGQGGAETVLVDIPGRVRQAEVIRCINNTAYLNYKIRPVRINSYLDSLYKFMGLLSMLDIRRDTKQEVELQIVNMMRKHIEKLRNTGKYEELAEKVRNFELRIHVYDVLGEFVSAPERAENYRASSRDIDRQWHLADANMAKCGIANVYVKKCLKDFGMDDPDACKIDCIIFAADEECIAGLNRYAKRRLGELNDAYRRQIAIKGDKALKEYKRIMDDSDEVTEQVLALPKVLNGSPNPDGKDYDNHLYVNDNGFAKIKLNSWEEAVVKEEAVRSDFSCWLRNVSRASWALCIPYETGGSKKAMYPDFLVVRRDASEGEYVLDILEPHGQQFGDNLAKAKGMAEYAKKEEKIGRVQLIRMSTNDAGVAALKRLDVSRTAVRDKVLNATSNEELDHLFDQYGFFGA